VGWLWGGTTENNVPSLDSGTGLGWISFSGPNYGVTVPPITCTGSACNVIGYAWSSNLGWIDFQPLGNPPTTLPSIGVRRNGNNLEGWARIVSYFDPATGNDNINTGGWSGWIKLSGTISSGGSYGVAIIPGTPPTEIIQGPAWSEDLGWIDFNGTVNGSSPPPPPTCSLYASPNTGSSPLSGNLTWTTQNNPITCVASGGWSGNQNPSGSIPPGVSYGPIIQTTTYSLNCTNSAGSNSCSTRATITSLTATCSGLPNPAPLTGGQAQVTWNTQILAGTGPYTYAWQFNPAPSQTGATNQPSVFTRYTTAGTKNALVTVTDTSVSPPNNVTQVPCQVQVGSKGILHEILPFF